MDALVCECRQSIHGYDLLSMTEEQYVCVGSRTDTEGAFDLDMNPQISPSGDTGYFLWPTTPGSGSGMLASYPGTSLKFGGDMSGGRLTHGRTRIFKLVMRSRWTVEVMKGASFALANGGLEVSADASTYPFRSEVLYRCLIPTTTWQDNSVGKTFLTYQIDLGPGGILFPDGCYFMFQHDPFTLPSVGFVADLWGPCIDSLVFFYTGSNKRDSDVTV